MLAAKIKLPPAKPVVYWVNPSKGSQNREPLRGGVRRTAPKLISLANNYFDHRAPTVPYTDSKPSPTDAKVKPFGVPWQSRGFTSLKLRIFMALPASVLHAVLTNRPGWNPSRYWFLDSDFLGYFPLGAVQPRYGYARCLFYQPLYAVPTNCRG